MTSGLRTVLFSPWTVLIEFIILGFFGIGVGQVIERYDDATIAIGWAMAAGSAFLERDDNR